MDHRSKIARPLQDKMGRPPQLIAAAVRHFWGLSQWPRAFGCGPERWVLRAWHRWPAASTAKPTHNRDRGDDILIFPFFGLALSLLAIEHFPSFVAMMAAMPLM